MQVLRLEKTDIQLRNAGHYLPGIAISDLSIGKNFTIHYKGTKKYATYRGRRFINNKYMHIFECRYGQENINYYALSDGYVTDLERNDGNLYAVRPYQQDISKPPTTPLRFGQKNALRKLINDLKSVRAF